MSDTRHDQALRDKRRADRSIIRVMLSEHPEVREVSESEGGTLTVTFRDGSDLSLYLGQ